MVYTGHSIQRWWQLLCYSATVLLCYSTDLQSGAGLGVFSSLDLRRQPIKFLATTPGLGFLQCHPDKPEES